MVRSSGGTNSLVHAIARESRGSRSVTDECSCPTCSMTWLISSADPAVTSATDERVRNGTTTGGAGSAPAVVVAEARSWASTAASRFAGSAALRPSASHSSYSRTISGPKSMVKVCCGRRRT